MEDKNETCDTTLQLGLGVGKYAPFFVNEERKKKKKDEVSNGVHHHNYIRDLDSISKTLINHHEFENYANNKRNSKHNKNGGVDHSVGRKLKLSKEQSTMLEESFNIQNTPSLAQKQELADKLNLKPRQVEVWFQNRRARTKLKQREIDCEVLKKCCENLSGENKRLKKEVQELRSVLNFIHSSPFCIQASKSTVLTLCPFEVKNNGNK